MALVDLEGDTCHGCGQSRTESLDPANEGRYSAQPHRCHACAAMSRAVRAWSDAGGTTDGVTFYVTKDG
jgi:hypothetical protein